MKFLLFDSKIIKGIGIGGGARGAPLADLVLKSQLMIWLYDMILEYFTTNTGYTANLTTNLGIFFCCKTIAKAIISLIKTFVPSAHK